MNLRQSIVLRGNLSRIREIRDSGVVGKHTAAGFIRDNGMEVDPESLGKMIDNADELCKRVITKKSVKKLIDICTELSADAGPPAAW